MLFRHHLLLLLLLLSPGSLLAESAGEAPRVPLYGGSGGALEIDANVGDESVRFLLDTGAAMVTISTELLRRVEHQRGVTQVREVGARLADGRIRLMPVYRLPQLSVSGCELGTVEAIVVPGKGRNLLGLNALAQAAPLTLNLTPSPNLVLGGCGRVTVARSGASSFAPAAFVASPLY